MSEPKGWLWVDWSGVSALVVCERCRLTHGPLLDRVEAHAWQLTHRNWHRDRSAAGLAGVGDAGAGWLT